jgi:hypothetical protein
MIRILLARPAAILLTLPLAVVLSIGAAGAAAQIEEEKSASFPIAAEAKAFVGRFGRMELLKDEVFIKALEELAKGRLPPEAQADAFALMQERIGWLFVGAARLFPKQGYAQTIAQILTTYFRYQEKMPADLEVGPLLELARTARGGHPLRASNALLLATILNHKAAKEAVRKAIDAQAIEKAAVPAIDLHNLSLAAALTRDGTVVRKLVELLPAINSEESREDVIAVTTIYSDEKLRGMLEQFVRRLLPVGIDNSVETALIVLAREGPTEQFQTFYKSLGKLTKDKEDLDRLRDLWDSGFRDRLQSDDASRTALKLWDEFTFTVREGGGTITDGRSFRCGISFR